MKRSALLIVGLIVGMTVAAMLPASGDGRDVFRSDVAASPGANRPVRTVSSGGVPWVISAGSDIRLSGDGRLRADVRGLLITGTGTGLDGTTGPVHQVAALVTCTNPASGDAGAPSMVATTAVPLSAAGNARIDQTVSVPGPCIAPVVLVLANSASGPWIAASGF
jgi:hypothetical protein